VPVKAPEAKDPITEEVADVSDEPILSEVEPKKNSTQALEQLPKPAVKPSEVEIVAPKAVDETELK